MKLSTLGTIFVLLSLSPSLSTASPLDARASDGVWICAGKDWKEPCGWVKAWESDTLCRGFSYPESQYLSFGPDSGVTCTVFTDEHCITAKDGTDSKAVSFPGDSAIPGPAYQGGQGTAHSPAYHAYKCHPNPNKRGVDGNEAGNEAGNDKDHDMDKPTVVSIKNFTGDTNGVTNRDAGGLPLLAISNPLRSRATDGVWVCPEANWGGVCSWTHITADTWTCGNINPELKAWSIGPDKDIVCKVYEDANCPISLDLHTHIKYFSTNFPGNVSVAGPGAQGGQGAANVTTYKSWYCWPIMGKRSTNTNDKLGTNNMTTVTSVEDSRVNARTVDTRGDHVLYTCSSPHWQDTCQPIPITAKSESEAPCNPLPYPRSSSISFGPDKGVMCKVYNWSCYDDASSHDTTVIQHPGSDQMSKASETQASGATTWKCWLI